MIGLGLGGFDSSSHLEDDPGWFGAGAFSNSRGDAREDSAYAQDSDNGGIDILDNVLSLIDNFATALLQEAPYKLKCTTNKLRERLSKEPQLLNRHVRRRVDDLKSRMNEPPAVAFRDKFSFFVGVNNVCLMFFILAAFPGWMPIYYLAQSVILIPVRFWMYYRRSWHYFTFDLCYFVNFLTLLYLFLYPDSTPLLSAAFALSHGPVIWAVVQWRNSLVFHSLDKVTSCFIHMTPCVVLYCCRWGAMSDRALSRIYPACRKDLLEFKECWKCAMFYYFVWQLTYYIWVNLVKRKKVEAGERVTSFTYLVNQHQARSGHSFFWRVLNLLGPQGRLFMFMLAQFAYAGITTLPVRIFWHVQPVHAALIYIMFAACVWNGANYYIEVFSKSYADRLSDIGHQVLECYQDAEDDHSQTSSACGASAPNTARLGQYEEEDSWEPCVPQEHDLPRPPNSASMTHSKKRPSS